MINCTESMQSEWKSIKSKHISSCRLVVCVHDSWFTNLNPNLYLKVWKALIGCTSPMKRLYLKTSTQNGIYDQVTFDFYPSK